MAQASRLPRPLRFIAAGGTATASHWLTMALLIAAGTLPAVATAVGAVVGAYVNYLLQKTWTFRSTLDHGTTMPRYLGACLVLWCANLLLFMLLMLLPGMAVALAQFVTTAFVALLSYVLYRGMVFGE